MMVHVVDVTNSHVCHSSVRFHNYLDVDSHKVTRSINGSVICSIALNDGSGEDSMVIMLLKLTGSWFKLNFAVYLYCRHL